MSDQKADSQVTETDSSTIKHRTLKKTIWLRGLLALVAVLVLIEAHAKLAYDLSIRKLTALLVTANQDDSDVSIQDARGALYGFESQSLRYQQDKPVLIASWSSLLKSYMVEVRLSTDETVLDIQTVDSIDESLTDQPVKKNYIQSLKESGRLPPRPGMDKADRTTVQLANPGLNEKWHRKTRRPVHLYRELFRQAFLIAARDELGLQTRDAGLGEFLNEVRGPARRPFQIVVANRHYSSPAGGFAVEIHEFGTTPEFIFDSREIELTPETTPEEIVAIAEKLSRTWFAEFLKSQDFGGKRHRYRDAGKADPAARELMKSGYVVSLAKALRKLHGQIRNDGESAERLAELAWCYALLGEMTSFVPGPMPVVCQARALLYAERFRMKAEKSALSVLARARVRTLIGLHPSARDDMEKLRSMANVAQQNQLEQRYWSPSLDALLAHDYARLRQLMTLDSDLTTLVVNFQVTHALQQFPARRAVAGEFLRRMPGHALAMDLTSRNGGLVRNFEAAQEELRGFTAAFRKRLLTVAELPETLAKVAREDPQDISERIKQRLRMVRELRIDGEPGQDSAEPSLSFLGGFLREVNFVEACRMVKYERSSLYVNADETMKVFQDLTTGHPLEPYFTSLGWQPKVAHKGASQLIDLRFWPRMNRNTEHIVRFMRSWGAKSSVTRNRLKEIHSSLAPTFPDQAWSAVDHPERDGQMAALDRMTKIAPESPLTVSIRIQLNWADSKQYALEWEKKFADSAIVQRSLGEALRESYRFEEARRCLSRYTELRPGPESKTHLAWLDLHEGNVDGWKRGMEEAAKISDPGLGQAHRHSQIAHVLMHRGRPGDAMPHAQLAAETGSQWGLLCMADCCEMLGRWDEALELQMQSNARYGPGMQAYFWSQRTGRGDPDAIANGMGSWLTGLLNDPHQSSRTKAALYAMFNDGRRGAIQQFKDADYGGRYLEGTFPLVNRLLLIDELGADVDLKAEAGRAVYTGIICIVHERLSTTPIPVLAEIASIVKRRNGKDRVNVDRMNWLIRAPGLSGGHRTDAFYFTGRLLLNEGRQDEALPYLHLAATSPFSGRHCAVLAGFTLQQLGEPVGSRRSTELETREEEELVDLLDEFDKWQQIGDAERASLRLAKIEELNPKWAPGLAARGRVLMEQKKFEEAIASLTLAIVEEPAIPELRYLRGSCRRDLGRYQKALNDYRKALELNPEDDMAHWHMGMMLAACPDDSLRNGNQAMQHVARFEGVMASAASVRQLDFLRAVAHAEIGNFTKAEEHARYNWGRDINMTREQGEQLAESFKRGEPYRFPAAPAE